MGVFSEYLNFRSPINDISTILLCLALSLVVWVLFYVLKNVLRMQKYSGLPGLKFYWFDLRGLASLIKFSPKGRNGYSIETYTLQSFEGVARLFPNDAIIAGWVGFHHVALANSPEAIRAIMNDSSLIEKSLFYKFVEPVMRQGLVTSIGSKWKPMRRMLNPSYHVSVLMDFIPIYNDHAGKLVKILLKEPEGEIIELFKPISLCVLDIVGETILGTKIGAQEEKNKGYIDGLRTTLSITMERMIRIYQWPGFIFRYTENGKKFYQHLSTVNEYTASLLKQKKKEYVSAGPNANSKRKPLMDVLLELHMEKKQITEEDIMDEIDTFTVASNESTSASLMFTLHFVGLDKDIQAKAHQELDDIFGDDKERPVEKEDLMKMNYIECIIKESLRLFPTVPIIAREVLSEKTICGYTLPKGTTLVVIPHILHRDPKVFPDPERFDPSRFFAENASKRNLYAYIPFSAGARNCIGQKFAMMEMKIVLAHILRNFTIESLDPRDKILPAPEITLKTDTNVRFKLFTRK